MTLEDIFRHLASSELQQLSLTDYGNGLSPEGQQRVLPSINLGLLELHKRFLIREGRVVVQVDAAIRTYLLETRYAESNGDSLEPIKYIKDGTGDAFQGDVLRIERVFDETGTERSLNDEGDPDGVLTTSHKALWVPADTTIQQMRVDYRAGPATLELTTGGPPASEIEVDLPATYLEPLLLYVASRMMNPVGAPSQSGFHEGNNYAAKFEQACKRLENLNYRLDRTHQTTKFEDRGFV